MRSGSKLRLTVVSALLLAGVSCKKEIGKIGIDLKLDHRELSNGLKVVMIEDRSVPVISYQTWIGAGSVDERPGLTGIAHLFEHLMFKGTEKYGPKQFFEQLEAKGAQVNAFTTRDYTAYYENFTPSLLEKVVDMESDRLAHLKLDEQLLVTERNVVFEERRMRIDNSPAGKMQEALWGLSFEVHPYRWPVIGHPEDLARITVEDLREFFKTHYQPGNVVIVVAGNIDPDGTYDLIKRYYGKIPGRKRPERKFPAEPKQSEERRLTLYDEIASERFSWGYPITSAHEEDSYALDVLANILFEGTSSRGYRELVEEKEIVLGISGSAFTPAYPGLFIVSGTMKGGLSSELVEPVFEEVLREVQDHGVSREEIEKAVKQLTVQLVDSVRTPQGMAQMVGLLMTMFGNTDRFYEDLEKYTKVSMTDIQRVARKYLIRNNRTVIRLVPASRRKL